jgi:hypothetical protein
VKTPEQSNAEALTPVVLRWAAFATGLRALLASLAHYFDWVYRWETGFAVAIYLLLGAAYASDARRSVGDALWHGGMVGAIAGFIGGALNAVLADRPAIGILVGTLTGAVAGAFGGRLAMAAIPSDEAD